MVEGHFIPRENLYLSFLARGKISEILVKQGDQVTEGQVLVKLGDSQQAEAAVTGAKPRIDLRTTSHGCTSQNQ